MNTNNQGKRGDKMIKSNGQKWTPAQIAKQIVIGEMEIPAAFIDRYLETVPTQKESEAIFEAIERIRLRLCDKWNFDTFERSYR
jgi:hypothetical protein